MAAADDRALSVEANHRIANSLSLIVGLVRLHTSQAGCGSRELSGKEARRLLEDVAGRIEAVGLLHRMLSVTPSRDTVELGDYLRGVCTALAASLSFTGRLDLTARGSALHVVRADQAALLALVVNEMVTNAVKYAHPNGAGTIRVAWGRDADGALSIEVADDGVGLPTGFDPHVDGGLGLHVVRLLGAQLRAALDFDSSQGGLRFRLSLPAQASRASTAA